MAKSRGSGTRRAYGTRNGPDPKISAGHYRSALNNTKAIALEGNLLALFSRLSSSEVRVLATRLQGYIDHILQSPVLRVELEIHAFLVDSALLLRYGYMPSVTSIVYATKNRSRHKEFLDGVKVSFYTALRSKRSYDHALSLLDDVAQRSPAIRVVKKDAVKPTKTLTDLIGVMGSARREKLEKRKLKK